MVQTQLANDIDVTECRSQYDASCKVLLAEKAILARILKECADEFKDVDLDVIEHQCIESEPQISSVPVHRDTKSEKEEGEKENGKAYQCTHKIEGSSTEDTSVNEGLVQYDVRFLAAAPDNDTSVHLIINVEAQNDCDPGYPLIKRGEYYGSRMISAQYGVKFEHSHYELIQKVYTIWLCMDPKPEKEDSINKYEFCEKHLYGNYEERKTNYDLIDVIMIYLGNEKSADSLIRLLTVLLSNSVSKEEKKEVLENEYGIPMTEQLEREVDKMCNLSDGVFNAGEEKGEEKNLVKNLISLMKNFGWCESKAMDALDVSEEERPKISALLRSSFS